MFSIIQITQITLITVYLLSPTLLLHMNSLIATLVIGAVSGWLAGQIRQGYGFGVLGNIIVGILGAFVGNWFLGSILHMDLGGGLLGTIGTSVIGALILLFLVGLIKKNN